MSKYAGMVGALHANRQHAVAKIIEKLSTQADKLAAELGRVVDSRLDRVFEDWLDKENPSGDVSGVQYKFENSSEYKDFVAEFGNAKLILHAYHNDR